MADVFTLQSELRRNLSAIFSDPMKVNVDFLEEVGEQYGIFPQKSSKLFEKIRESLANNKTSIEEYKSKIESPLRLLAKSIVYDDNTQEFPQALEEVISVLSTATLMQDIITSTLFGIGSWPDNIAARDFDTSVLLNSKQYHPQVAIRARLHYLIFFVLAWNIDDDELNEVPREFITPFGLFWITKLQGLVGMADSLPDLLSFEKNGLKGASAMRFKEAFLAIETDMRMLQASNSGIPEYGVRVPYMKPLIEAVLADIASARALAKTLYPSAGKRKEGIKVQTPDRKTQKVACNMCGATGNLYECAACSKAVYCSQKCQSEHWEFEHAEECS